MDYHGEKNAGSLRKFVAPEFIYGIGARKLLGNYLGNLFVRRILFVTDPGIIAAGWAGELETMLSARGIAVSLFAQVTPNPRDHEVMAGVAQYQEESCEAIVALGGGSAIDCAKGIGIVAANGGHILDYESVDTVEFPCPPLACIPTTAGSSADVSQFAIILDTLRHTKIAIISKTVVPDIALVDPELTYTMDPFLTACTGIDALTHAVEALLSNAASPITDLHALEAIRLVFAHLVGAVENPQHPEFRSGMMLGSLHAGLAFSNASLGAVHAMAHSLGGYKDLPHGLCNALLLPGVLQYNYPMAKDRCARILAAAGVASAGVSPEILPKILDDTVRSLLQRVGITKGLSAYGVTRDELADLAKMALQDPCIVTNPRPPTASELEALYAEAL